MDERYGPAHPVALTPDGFLAALAGTDRDHGQFAARAGHRPAGAGARVEAVAPDGLIEAVSLPGARFVVGVQWHPEYKPLENPVSRALFAAFGEPAAQPPRARAERRARPSARSRTFSFRVACFFCSPACTHAGIALPQIRTPFRDSRSGEDAKSS